MDMRINTQNRSIAIFFLFSSIILFFIFLFSTIITINNGNEYIIPLFLLSISAVIVAVAVTPFIKQVKRNKIRKKFVNTGVKTEGIISNISINTRNNNQHTYKVLATIIDPNGKVRNYWSHTLNQLGNANYADLKQQPILINVYLDNENFNNYYVDTQIPELKPLNIGEIAQKTINHLRDQRKLSGPTE